MTPPRVFGDRPVRTVCLVLAVEIGLFLALCAAVWFWRAR